MREYEEILTAFDVISFDVFDTLLLRPYLKPTDLWRDLERRINASGFAAERYQADRAAYAEVRGRDGEPTLDEVYAKIPQWERMKQLELDQERKVLTVNPEMLKLWIEAGRIGKKRVIVSDMYLPRAFVEDVLKENGVDGWDGFYLSSDRQKKKRTGELFGEVVRDFNVSSDRVLHVGDDLTADMRAANEAGIVAYGYQKVVDKFLSEVPFLRQFLYKDPNVEKDLLAGALSLGWHLFKCDHPDWTYWHRLGFLLSGTLGYAYMRFCGECAKAKGIDHFMMVARDGYTLQKICNLLYPEIRTDYFYASRVTALFATQYFGAFGVGVINRRRYCLQYLKEHEGLSITAEDETKFLNTGRLTDVAQKALDRVSARERAQCERYFAQFRIDPTHTALVDGTSGHFTVQKFLGEILHRDVFTFYLQTLVPPQNAKTLYQCSWNDARYLGLSEFLLSAPTPPVDRVENGKPVFKQDMKFFERFKVFVYPEMDEGALACARILKKQDIDISKLTWLDISDAFMDNQSVEDREMMSFVRDSVAPGHEGNYFEVIRPRSPGSEIQLLGIPIVRSQYERRGENYVEIVRWFGRYGAFRVSRWRNVMSVNNPIRRLIRKILGH